jgi:hypothetical protein
MNRIYIAQVHPCVLFCSTDFTGMLRELRNNRTELYRNLHKLERNTTLVETLQILDLNSWLFISHSHLVFWIHIHCILQCEPLNTTRKRRYIGLMDTLGLRAYMGQPTSSPSAHIFILQNATISGSQHGATFQVATKGILLDPLDCLDHEPWGEWNEHTLHPGCWTEGAGCTGWGDDWIRWWGGCGGGERGVFDALIVNCAVWWPMFPKRKVHVLAYFLWAEGCHPESTGNFQCGLVDS